MKHKLVIDHKRRQIFYTEELKKRVHKSISVNQYLSSSVRAASLDCLSTTFTYSSRIMNYCLITARSKGVLRKFKVSRMVFKELASNGYLNGVRKGSW